MKFSSIAAVPHKISLIMYTFIMSVTAYELSYTVIHFSSLLPHRYQSQKNQPKLFKMYCIVYQILIFPNFLARSV